MTDRECLEQICYNLGYQKFWDLPFQLVAKTYYVLPEGIVICTEKNAIWFDFDSEGKILKVGTS